MTNSTNTPPALAPELQRALAELRDIHLPPAPETVGAGGWSLAVLCVLAAAGTVWLAYLRHPVRVAALRELGRIRRRHDTSGDPRALLGELSTLVRRYCLVAYPDRPAAGLTGEAWLAFLDGASGGRAFRAGPGQVLAVGPYAARPPQYDAAALLAVVEQWIRDASRHERAGRRLPRCLLPATLPPLYPGTRPSRGQIP